MRIMRVYVGIVMTTACVFLCPFLWNCSPSSTANSEKYIEIVSPNPGDEFENYYNIIVVIKYKPTVVGNDLRHKYSIDDGKVFKGMTFEKIDSKHDEPGRGEYVYEVIRWKIIDDSLKNVKPLIRIEEYGNGGAIFDMIGPITIR